MNRYRQFAMVILTIFCAAFLWYFAWPSPGVVSADRKTYTVGVVPQFEQRRLHAAWKPVLDNLEKRTGLQFDLNSTLTIDTFEQAVSRGEFDFLYLNPYLLVQVHGPQGYIPLVADKAPLRGILVVRRDSTIRTPADLKGKVVAFPSANAIGATLLPRADLDQIFQVAVTPLFVKTHSSVYLHVVKDLVAAGGGVEKTLREQSAAIRSALRVIYATRAIPSHPVAAHPRVPKEVRDKVRGALLAISASPEGRALLKKIPVEQFIPVTYDDYAVMSSWGIERYWKPVKED